MCVCTRVETKSAMLSAGSNADVTYKVEACTFVTGFAKTVPIGTTIEIHFMA